MSYLDMVDAARSELAGADRDIAKQTFNAVRDHLRTLPMPDLPSSVAIGTRHTRRKTAQHDVDAELVAARAERAEARSAFWVATTYLAIHADLGYDRWIDFAEKKDAPAIIKQALHHGRKAGNSTRVLVGLLHLHSCCGTDIYRKIVQNDVPLPLGPRYSSIEQLAKLTRFHHLSEVIARLPAHHNAWPSTVRYDITTAQRKAGVSRELSVKDLQTYIVRHTKPEADLQLKYREPLAQHEKRKQPRNPITRKH
jgi:hypothetical protein